MKNLFTFLMLFALLACSKHKASESKKDRFYYVRVKSFSRPDTSYIDKPEHVSPRNRFLTSTTFYNESPGFARVAKYDNRPAPVDGETVIYQTEDLGIIYSVNTSWKSYRRLHSTNDSIERRISKYIDDILSRSDLVIEGDIPLKYYDKIGAEVIKK